MSSNYMSRQVAFIKTFPIIQHKYAVKYSSVAPKVKVHGADDLYGNGSSYCTGKKNKKYADDILTCCSRESTGASINGCIPLRGGIAFVPLLFGLLLHQREQSQH